MLSTAVLEQQRAQMKADLQPLESRIATVQWTVGIGLASVAALLAIMAF